MHHILDLVEQGSKVPPQLCKWSVEAPLTSHIKQKYAVYLEWNLMVLGSIRKNIQLYAHKDKFLKLFCKIQLTNKGAIGELLDSHLNQRDMEKHALKDLDV